MIRCNCSSFIFYFNLSPGEGSSPEPDVEMGHLGKTQKEEEKERRKVGDGVLAHEPSIKVNLWLWSCANSSASVQVVFLSNRCPTGLEATHSHQQAYRPA